MQEVRPAIGDLLVRSSYLETGFFPIGASRFPAGHPALPPRQLLFLFLVCPRVLDMPSIRTHGKVLEAQIDADIACGLRQGLDLDFADDRDKILACRIPSDRRGQNPAFKSPGVRELDETELGEL